MIRLVVGEHEVTATLGPTSRAEPFGDTPESLWQATLTACRTTLASYDVQAVEVTTTSDLVAIWDVETMGSPGPLLGAGALSDLGDAQPHTWALVTSGRYVVGTLESYLVARLTRGTWHVTATATPLPAPAIALPEPVRPGTAVGRTEPSVFLGLDVAIRLGS